MNARMLHGILVFYVSSPHCEHHKIHFQNLVCPKCAQNRVFHPKIETEKASWKSPRSLISQWQRGWDSNPRWLITTLDFELLKRRFFTHANCDFPWYTRLPLSYIPLYRSISFTCWLSKSCQILHIKTEGTAHDTLSPLFKIKRTHGYDQTTKYKRRLYLLHR